MPTQCQTSVLHCRVSFLESPEMISKDVSFSPHEDITISLVHHHCPPSNGLLSGLLQAILSIPSRLSKQDVWQPDPCPSSQDRQEVKIREKSETHSLPFTDANCSLSANFREPKFLSVLFRISASKAARYALERNSTLPAFKASHRNIPLPSHRWY